MKNAEYFHAWALRHLLNPYFKFASSTARALMMPDIPLIESMEAPKVTIIY